jgi:hypothetical protein
MALYVAMLTSTMDFWYYFLGWDSVSFAFVNTFLWFVTEYYHRHGERYLSYKEMKNDMHREDDSD